MRELFEQGLPTRQGPELRQWSIRRNCSVTPGQLGGLYASLCAVSFGIAGVFWWAGAPWVMPFAALELLALAAACLVYARHAADAEHIRLEPGRLVVEQEVAGRVSRREFATLGMRVEGPSGRNPLVALCSGGQAVQVGRHLRMEQRVTLARELRQALHGSPWVGYP